LPEDNKKSQKYLGETIQEIWNRLDEIVQASETEAAAWRAGVAGIWDQLEGWIEERIINILIRALDKEVEKEDTK
jgi:hypothetical protein